MATFLTSLTVRHAQLTSTKMKRLSHSALIAQLGHRRSEEGEPNEAKTVKVTKIIYVSICLFGSTDFTAVSGKGGSVLLYLLSGWVL